MDRRVQKVTPDKRVPLARQDLLAWPGLLVALALEDWQVSLVSLVPLEQPERREFLDLREQRVPLDHKVTQVSRVILGCQEPQGHRVQLACRAP